MRPAAVLRAPRLDELAVRVELGDRVGHAALVVDENAPVGRLDDRVAVSEPVPLGELGPGVAHLVLVGVAAGDERLGPGLVGGPDGQRRPRRRDGGGGERLLEERAAGGLHRGSPIGMIFGRVRRTGTGARLYHPRPALLRGRAGRVGESSVGCRGARPSVGPPGRTSRLVCSSDHGARRGHPKSGNPLDSGRRLPARRRQPRLLRRYLPADATCRLPAHDRRPGPGRPPRREPDAATPGDDLARPGRGPLRPAAACGRGGRGGRRGRPSRRPVRAGLRHQRPAGRDRREARRRERHRDRRRPRHRARSPGRRHDRVEHGVPDGRAGGGRRGRRGDPAVAVLLQPRDGRRHRRVPGGGRADGRQLPAAGRRDRGRRHAADAGGGDRLAEQPDRGRLPRGDAAGDQRPVPGPRAVPPARRGVRVLRVRPAGHPRRGPALLARVGRRVPSRTRSRSTR